MAFEPQPKARAKAFGDCRAVLGGSFMGGFATAAGPGGGPANAGRLGAGFDGPHETE